MRMNLIDLQRRSAAPALLAALSTSLLSCSGGDRCRALPEAKTAEWEPGEEREPEGESTDARIADAGAQTWDLGLDLLRLTDPVKHPSVAASPASMTIALGLAQARWPMACGTTILEAMHAVEEGDALHNTLGASVRALEARALPAGGEGEDPLTITLRNSTWALGVAASVKPHHALYGATAHSVARADTEERRVAIREVINCVIEEQSDGLLVDFLPGTQPMGDTTDYDVSVAVLKGPWANGFDSVGPQGFRLDSGELVSQEMMNVSATADLFTADDFVAVSVPLRGDELAVMFFVPREGAHADLTTFTESLTAEDLRVV